MPRKEQVVSRERGGPVNMVFAKQNITHSLEERTSYHMLKSESLSFR